MKHSMIMRSTFREIRDSFGRFLAIMAIVALGVGLFSGLKITKADFLKSTTNYYGETAFYDYRILGELGFSQSQVDYFASFQDVRAAEGALSVDMLYEENGVGKVGRFHSITEDVNRVVLTAGRMPENAEECLADSQYYTKQSIGELIVLGGDNASEDLEQFEGTTFRIVGIVKSPLYLQYERGNTSLGDGGINAFFYLPRESFSADYYTEIYLKFRQDFDLYSDAYKEFLDRKKEELEEAVQRACQMRFDELPGLIADAESTLSQKKEEGQEGLKEARRELLNAEKELEDASQQIEDGKKQLKEGREELLSARDDLENAKKEIEEKEAELEKGNLELEDGQKKLEENEKLLTEKETELEQAKSLVSASQLQVQLGEMQYKFTMDGLISEQKNIDEAREDLRQRSEAADRLEETAENLGLQDQYADRIARERDSIREENSRLDVQLEDLHQRYLAALETGEQISAGKRELEEGQKQIEEGTKALREGKDALFQAKLELLDAQKKLAEGTAALREAKMQIRQGEKDLADGEKTLLEKERELEDGIQEYRDGKKEYEEGMREYLDGRKEFLKQVSEAERDIFELKEKHAGGKVPEGYLLGRNTNTGYVCFENDSAIVDGIANVFPVFFFLVAALVCITTMNRMVEEQRTQIGMLKAMGYSDQAIMFKYLFYSGFAALTGCVIGYVGGTLLFPFIIWTVYGIMYQAGPIAFTFSPVLAFLSLTVSLLCSVGTTVLSCGRELGGWAAQLMRPRAPKAGKRVFLEYLPFVWKRLSFLRKVAVRNIMRYKKRLFMMVLGIGGCTGLLVTGFGIRDSIADVGKMQYKEIQLYDISVMLQSDMDEEFERKLLGLHEKGMESFLAFRESAYDLVGENTKKSITVLTFPRETTDGKLRQYIDLHTPQGEPVSMPGLGEAVITDRIAADFHICIGDEILLQDEEMREMRLKVSGIAQNYIYNYVYLGQETWERERGEQFSAKSLYLKLADGYNLHDLSSEAMRLDGVANLTVTADMLEWFNNMMSSLNLIVVVVIVCAAGLAFIVLYNLTNINITERLREIATIKVLGFFPGETAMYVFRENMVLTLLGAVAGLGMGKWLHAFVMHEVNVDMVSFDVRILPVSYLYSVILTFVFAAGVNLLMNRKLEEINMTESLKSVD